MAAPRKTDEQTHEDGDLAMQADRRTGYKTRGAGEIRTRATGRT